jgi:hypothetical protein
MTLDFFVFQTKKAFSTLQQKNEDVRSKTVEEITRLIKGTPNSLVKLTLLPALSGMGGSGYSGYGYGAGYAAGAGFAALDANK